MKFGQHLFVYHFSHSWLCYYGNVENKTFITNNVRVLLDLCAVERSMSVSRCNGKYGTILGKCETSVSDVP